MEKKIVEYAIVKSPDAGKVVVEVNGMLKNGFIPLGGLATSGDQSVVYFAQALVKYGN